MGVAVVKAFLVGLIFMHLKYDWGKLYFMIVPVFILGTMMMIVLMPDIVMAWQPTEPPERGPSCFAPLTAWLVLPLALASWIRLSPPPSPPVPDDFGPVGPFSLTERSGKTVTQADLLGKVWVASFVFTRCTGPCPQVTGTMARLQSELGKEKDVRLVTFTVDPEHDDPKELTEYASHFQADPERWLFLTGKEKTIHRLVNKGFKVGVERNKDKDATPGTAIGHDPRLVLVDRQGHIRGYFYGVRDSRDDDPERAFEANLKASAKASPSCLRERTQ